jgi:hypothetical protein
MILIFKVIIFIKIELNYNHILHIFARLFKHFAGFLTSILYDSLQQN